MRILFVIEYYPPHIGGVEVVFENLCRGLAKRGHSVTIITSKLEHTKSLEVVDKVNIHRINTPNRYLFTIFAIKKALRLVREVDIIHTTTYTGAFPAWLVSKLKNKKCVITVHEILGSSWQKMKGMNWLSAKIHETLEKVIIRLPYHKLVAVSQNTLKQLKIRGLSEKKLAMIYNGIDDELFTPTNNAGDDVRQSLRLNGHFVYLYYGRPGLTKGVEYLVQAVPLIVQKIPKAILLLILARDPANRYHNIKDMIAKLNIKENVVIVDPVPRNSLPKYISAADCVVVPSLSEGFGFTAAESCAMAKPVVASNVDSLPEVVSGKYVLVEPGNPHQIANGVVSTFRKEIENHPVKSFSWDRCVDEYLQIYSEVVKI